MMIPKEIYQLIATLESQAQSVDVYMLAYIISGCASAVLLVLFLLVGKHTPEQMHSFVVRRDIEHICAISEDERNRYGRLDWENSVKEVTEQNRKNFLT